MNLVIRIYYFFDFFLFYVYDLVYASFKIGLDVITIKNLSRPGTVKMPLEASTKWEIMLLSNLITFSPGTMVVDFSDDKKYLYIYSMFINSEEETITELKHQLERRVLRLLR